MQTLVFLFTLLFCVAGSAMPVHAEQRVYSWWTDDVIIQLPEGVYVADEGARSKRYYTLHKAEEIVIKAASRRELDNVRDINDFMRSLNQPYSNRRIKNREWKEIATLTKGELNGTLYFLDVDRLIQVSYRLPVSSAWAKSLDSIEVIEKPKMMLKDPNCTGNNCICIGNNGVYYRGRLNELGPDLKTLGKGVKCLVADFDSNGFDDFVLSGGEGWASAHFMGPVGWVKAVHFDPGFPLRVYPKRSSVGPRNEPVTKNSGVLAGENRVYLWDGTQFVQHKLK